jgi:hypothetical protein
MSVFGSLGQLSQPKNTTNQAGFICSHRAADESDGNANHSEEYEYSVYYNGKSWRELQCFAN